MKKLLFFYFLLAFGANASAQDDYKPYGTTAEKPEWADKPVSMDLGQSYLETVMVRGKSHGEVRKEATEVIATRRSLTTGAVMMNTKPEESDGIIVSAKLISEYWEYNGAFYRGYFLFQTRKNRNSEFERVSITESFGFSPRAFVPGMAQIHKGSTLKGSIFIAGEVALLGGVVVAESMRASYTSKVGATHSASEKKTYIGNADTWENVRNGAIAGAVALYAWSVIDGVVAKGKPHIKIGDSRLRVAPYLTPEAGGVAFALNF